MKRKLSFWNLVFLNIAIVASLQQIPSTAIYGTSVILLFVIAGICFFLPTIVMTAFFTEHFAENGGSYLWVNAVYGKMGGFFAVCNQWLSNLIWYPTIFSLIAAFIAYLFDPRLVDNKHYILYIQLGVFWGITFLNFLGLKVSTWFSNICAVLGIFLPTGLSILLACLYFFQKNPAQISFHVKDFLPSIHHLSDVSYMVQIIVSLIGIEMAAVHAGDVLHSKQTYPRALWVSGFMILLLLIGTSLAISLVVPSQKISVVSGLMDAFTEFFETLHLKHFLGLTIGTILLGSLGTVTAWMFSSTRAMQIGSTFCHLPKFLQMTNRFGAPIGILILECIIFTFAVFLFYAMPTVNAGFWLLIIIASQATLIYYILLFFTAIKLSYQKKNFRGIAKTFFRPLMILGIFTCVVAIAIGFIPPQGQVEIDDPIRYLVIVGIGLILLLLIPFLLYSFSRQKLV